MTRYKMEPPWDFLLSASRSSLQSYELTRLSHIANLRKEISILLDQWVQESACAMLARLLIEKHERGPQVLERTCVGDVALSASSDVSDNILADRGVLPIANRGPA